MTSEQLPAVIQQLSATYRTRDGGLAKEFFGPCLRHCTAYSRAAGYFSSTALRTWSGALQRMVSEDIHVRLLISPELSHDDAEAFRQTTDDQQRKAILEHASETLLEQAIKFAENPDNREMRLQLLTWMIVMGQLEIRFAIPRHIEDAGIFHEKSGIFSFPGGHRVAFEGSANETASGHMRNYEKVQAFRSWIAADEPRVNAVEEDFETQWNGRDESLLVLPLTQRSLRLIREKAPSCRPDLLEDEPSVPNKQDKAWRHKREATDAFLAKGHGILEMATGTGKTSTALMILEELFASGKIVGAIISTEGTDLLDQWFQTLVMWEFLQTKNLRVIRQYGTHHNGPSFPLNPMQAIALVSRSQLAPLITQVEADARSKIIVIHDEVHGLGAPECLRRLQGTHAAFGYTLGLSATPEREYDEQGSAFIEREVGPVLFQFGLKEAIERGILVEFEYVALQYELTEGDKKRLAAVYSKKAARQREGNPMAQEELWTELARVYKTAEQKPEIFATYLRDHPEVIKHSIIFVEERSYGERILPTLDSYTHLYRTYYADDDRENLVIFAQGNIDCLITCHRISQGIDIKHLKSVVLMSSARARLETIQRIGRCMRVDPVEPNKRAVIVDFVRLGGERDGFEIADQDRARWLAELSTTLRLEQ